MAISLLVRGYDVLAAAVACLIGRPRPVRAVVIYYHAVNPDQRAGFARQIDWLAQNCRVIRADASDLRPLTIDRCPPSTVHRPLVAITFDDGFVSVLENALPELEKHQLPATWFVPTGCFGQPPSWVKNPNAPAARQRVMTREQVARFKNHPLITIGSHTVTHPRLSQLDDGQAARELLESKQTLEALLGQPVNLLGFPHGDHNARILELARRAGYSRVFTVQPRLAFTVADEWVTGRVSVEPDDWPLEFQLKALGAYRWLAA